MRPQIARGLLRWGFFFFAGRGACGDHRVARCAWQLVPLEGTPAASFTRLLHDAYTPLTRLLHDSYTPLTRLLHASYTPLTRLGPLAGAPAASFTRLLHASYTPLTCLLHAWVLSQALLLLPAFNIQEKKRVSCSKAVVKQ
jgi:hypothetical protein